MKKIGKYLFIALLFGLGSNGNAWANTVKAHAIPSYLEARHVVHAAFGRLNASKHRCVYNPAKKQKKCLPRHRSG